jgi:hypothetical protein
VKRWPSMVRHFSGKYSRASKASSLVQAIGASAPRIEPADYHVTLHGVVFDILLWHARLRQINPSGSISLFPKGKSPLRIPHPVPEEGALAIVTERWDGIAVDAAASCARWDRRAG